MALLRYYILLLCIFLLHTARIVSSSSSTYTSVAALDKFGDSEQLAHAREASSRHGTLILAARSLLDDSIVVAHVDPQEHRERVPGLKKWSTHEPQRNMIHPVVIPSSAEAATDEGVYIITSGVKADGMLLIKLVRNYCQRLWERYNAHASATQVADALSQILTNFLGYDRSKELSCAVGVPVLPRRGNDDDDEKHQLARPFGIQTLVLSTISAERSRSKNNIDKSVLLAVDPSGVQQGCVAHAMGRGSERASELLEKEWKRTMTTNQVKGLCERIVKEVGNVQQVHVEVLPKKQVDT